MANNDRTVQPDLQRFLAKRMGATTHDIDSSHVPMLSHPGLVIDVTVPPQKQFKDHPLQRENASGDFRREQMMVGITRKQSTWTICRRRSELPDKERRICRAAFTDGSAR